MPLQISHPGGIRMGGRWCCRSGCAMHPIPPSPLYDIHSLAPGHLFVRRRIATRAERTGTSRDPYSTADGGKRPRSAPSPATRTRISNAPVRGVA